MLRRLTQFSQYLLPYFVAILIFVTVLLPKIPLSEIEGTYVKIRPEDVFNLLVAAVWFGGMYWRKRSFWRSPLNLAIMLYWFVGLVSTISAIMITQVVDEKLAILHWLRRVEYMIFFFVGLAATPTVKHALAYTYTLFVATILAVLYGLGQVFDSWCSISTTNREFSKGECVPLTKGARPNATFGGHYDLAIFLSYVVPVILSVFFILKKNWQRALIVGLFFMTLWLLTLTQSRTAFVATLVTIPAMLWLYGKKLWVIGFGAMALLLVLVAGQDLLTRYKTTIQTIITPQKSTVTLPMPIEQLVYETTTAGANKVGTQSAIPGQEDLPNESLYREQHPVKLGIVDPALEARLSGGIRFQENWPKALNAFYRNPLLGSGYSAMGTLFADQYGFATDNDYLRMLGETGILGVVSFALIFLAFFKLANTYLRSRRTSKLARGLVIGFCAGIVGFFANAVFIDVFESSKLAILFWLFLGILTSVIQQELPEKEA